MRFGSAKDALDRGIATVFRDLAVAPVMPIYRNFFLGREPLRGWGLFQVFAKSLKLCCERARGTRWRFGIAVDDVTRPIATLSGGERQSVAIARAIHSGVKVLHPR